MTAAAVLALLIAGVVTPATAAEEDPCAIPAGERAPDPRCGETLDGRVPAEPSTGRQVARAALVVPRLATKAVFLPIVKTTDFLEYHHVVDWGRALLTTDDGLVGARPELQYSTSFLPTEDRSYMTRSQFTDRVTSAAHFLLDNPLPDVLIIDLSMSGEQPLEFLKQMRARTRFSKLPVLVVTDVPDPDLVRTALSWAGQPVGGAELDDPTAEDPTGDPLDEALADD